LEWVEDLNKSGEYMSVSFKYIHKFINYLYYLFEDI